EKAVDPRRERRGKGASGGAPEMTEYFPRFIEDNGYGMHRMRPLDFSCYAGASVFVSTAADMARFGMAMNEGELLRAETLQMLQEPQRLASGESTEYGLGWDVERVTLGGKE